MPLMSAVPECHISSCLLAAENPDAGASVGVHCAFGYHLCLLIVNARSFLSSLFEKAVYLTDEHQPDRTTSETPFFCYTHLLMKINVGALAPNSPKPNLDAPRTDGTDQQDAQLAPAYFDVSLCSAPQCPCA